MTLVSINERAKEYAMCHYGNLFSTEDPIFDEKERLWKVRLKSNYPRLIKNDDPEERYIRVLPLKGLGTMCFTESLQFVENCSSKRDESISRLRSYLEMWREQVENIVVSASAKQLAKTYPARNFLHPANMVLSNFRHKKDNVITFEELEKMRIRHGKIERWISLLEDLKLIKRIEIGYIYGEKFTQLEERTAEEAFDFETLSMAYILQKSYPLLKEIFHIQQFEPLIHLDTCYYRPALEAEEILCQSENSLFKRFVTDYSYRPNPELRHLLSELQQSDSLRRKDSFYFANDTIFQEMMELKSESPSM